MRSEIDAEVIQAEVADLPGTYIPLIFDVTDASAIEEAASTVSSALKGATLGALINNAGELYQYHLDSSQTHFCVLIPCLPSQAI